jgi:serpin B
MAMKTRNRLITRWGCRRIAMPLFFMCSSLFFIAHPAAVNAYPLDQTKHPYENSENAAEESTLAGDIDGSGQVDLLDLVGALQVLTESAAAGPVNPGADVNGDQRLGMGEAIYILRKIAGIEAPEATLVKSPAAYDAEPDYSEDDMQALVDGFSQFTFDFYHALANQPSSAGKNLFFSAYSIENALAMTWAGARNQTAAQMAVTLRYNLPGERFHPTLNALNIELNSRDDQPPASGDAFSLNLVNAVWSRIGYPFLAPYLDTIATNYDAGIRTLDFVNHPEPGRLTINQWVADQTYDKIRNLLPAGSISSYTAVVLTNAIYFKASWFNKFDPDLTTPGLFTRLDGNPVTVDMMHQQLDTRAVIGDGFDAVEFPYVSTRFPESPYPQELSMLVIIPHTGQFSRIESALDKAWVDARVSSLSSHTVDLTFPKFQFESEAKCKEILKGMGMTDAFVPLAADFSAMVDPGDSQPWIDEIYHKAFVAVDETGTEAAAATAVVMTDTSVPEPVTISADHPFIFLIRDNITRTILFTGRVLDPTA